MAKKAIEKDVEKLGGIGLAVAVGIVFFVPLLTWVKGKVMPASSGSTPVAG